VAAVSLALSPIAGGASAALVHPSPAVTAVAMTRPGASRATSDGPIEVDVLWEEFGAPNERRELRWPRMEPLRLDALQVVWAYQDARRPPRPSRVDVMVA
jgi:hypothetical protein